ncbi:hypothetical protein JZ751_015785, partial [Albula glossodonta]
MACNPNCQTCCDQQGHAGNYCKHLGNITADSCSCLSLQSLIIMPTQLEGAMDALISVFHNYSGNEGDKYKLNKGELKQLLNSELTDFLT